MSDMAEYWKDVKPIYKKMHDERVAKTPDRIEYTIQRFTKHNIPFELKNEETGQFNIRKRKTNNSLLLFNWKNIIKQ